MTTLVGWIYSVLGAVVLGVRVDGALDRDARLQRLQVTDHQVCFKGVRVVVVLAAAHLKGHAGLVLVVVVVVNDAHVISKAFLDVLGQRGLSAAGAAGDTDKDRVHHGEPSVYGVFPFRSLFNRHYYRGGGGEKQGGREQIFTNCVKTEKGG